MKLVETILNYYFTEQKLNTHYTNEIFHLTNTCLFQLKIYIPIW